MDPKEIASALIEREYAAQRSPEWFALREGMVTASEAAAALGVSKFKSKTVYILEKSGMKARDAIGAAAQHGIDNEDMVREYYEREYDQVVHEIGLVQHPVHAFIGASPDGVCESGRLLEIKCPSSKWRIANEVGKVIPTGYMIQMQLQMECCDLDVCDYLEYVAPSVSPDGEGHFYMTEVKRDREWFASVVEELRDVFTMVERVRADPKVSDELYARTVTIKPSCDIVF